MLCNVWIYILGPPISDQLLEYHQTTHIPWQLAGVGTKQEDEACKVAEGDGETSDHHHTRWGLYRQAGWDEFPICYLHLFAINFITVLGMIRYYVVSWYIQYSLFLFHLISCLLFRAVFFWEVCFRQSKATGLAPSQAMQLRLTTVKTRYEETPMWQTIMLKTRKPICSDGTRPKATPPPEVKC